MHYQNTKDFAVQLDAADPLKGFRNRYHIPILNGREVNYFCGNSLGLQPKSAKQYIDQDLKDWAELAIEGHFQAANPWYSYHEKLVGTMAKIIGARDSEVAIMNSLTVNLHLLMISFYRPDQRRNKIICEAQAFPSDLYAIDSQVKLHGFDPEESVIKLKPREGEQTVRHEDVINAINLHGDSLSLVMLGAVNYYSGQFFDLPAITAAAHTHGAFAGFDLAHAVGNVHTQLHTWDVDFACWCTYKYLNSGPGGVGGIFVHERHAKKADYPRLSGWFGNDPKTRFTMPEKFIPAPGAYGWQISNEPVLAMAAHRASLEIFEEAGMDRLLEKSKLLTGYLEYLLNEINNDSGEKKLNIITPSDSNQRGCQLSIVIKNNGKEVHHKLMEHGILADWRGPDVIRFAPVPLYNTFLDIWEGIDVLKSELV